MTPKLVTFGNPRLVGPAGDVIAVPEKAILATAYLATRPRSRATRADLAAFLWNEDAGNPLTNLRQLIARIKTRQEATGTTFLEFTDREVIFQTENAICDFSTLKEIPESEPVQFLASAIAIMNGEFLANVDTSSERSALWIEAERASYISRFSKAMEDAASQEATLRLHGSMVKEAAYRLLTFDHYNETAYRVLMSAFANEGHLARAKEIFGRYREMLRKDLDATPDTSVLEFTRRLFNETVPASAVGGQKTEGENGLQLMRRPDLPRILLVPPAPAGEDRNGAQIFAGLIEDITIDLCRARTLSVVASHTASKIAESPENRQTAYKSCNAAYALETRMSAITGQSTLYVSLVKIDSGEIIWAERYALDPHMLYHAHRSMTRQIATSVISGVERRELADLRKGATPGSYQYYLMGKQFLKSTDLPGVRRARKAFRQALRDAPEFSAALGGVSRTEHVEWLLTARGDMDLLRSAEANSLRAIEADGNDGVGYHQLGVTKLYMGAFDESLDAFEFAERNAPSHADMIADYADTLVHASEPLLGLRKIELAIELNPRCPDLYWWTAAGANYSLERYREALDCLSHVADQSNVARFTAACWAMLGEKRKATSYMRKTLALYPDFEVDRWLSIIKIREPWQRELYREGLLRAGFR